MLRFLAAIVGGLMLSGCVGTKIVKADMPAIEKRQHPMLTIAKRPLPSFAAITAGKAMFGALGAMAMIDAGNTVVAENGIEDPAIQVSQELGRLLGERLSIPVVLAQHELTSTKPSEIAKQYPGAGLILDVQTVNWSFGYFPSDWDNYRVIYSMKLRLVDASTGKAVAEGFCARVPKDNAGAPSREQLLADKASELKTRLRNAASECGEELKRGTLGLS
ncbi:hypothetical protein [Candidatus Paracaedibacter symbiosus]|uniref:hypothetical protein n=1 Tax=Candidatus Paracaedibacter symbiosus TaxID=244582 RepID=UPI000691BDC4|nr:hypothetical protein [Candidatus Paracaedibacter symbiosus]